MKSGINKRWAPRALWVGALLAGASARAEAPSLEAPAATGEGSGQPTMNDIRFEDYQGFEEKWKLVTIRFRKDTNEVRIVYANPVAWKALLAGSTDYPDGAIFSKIGLGTQEDPAFRSSEIPSGARRFQFMVRDKKKYKETDGWGYAIFNGQGVTGGGNPMRDAIACNACHRIVPERGLVFSVPAELSSRPGADKKPGTLASHYFDFQDRGVEALPAELRRNVPSRYHNVRLLLGEIQKSLFQGTLDEIRPTLAAEAVAKNLPAALVSADQKSYVLVFPSSTETECRNKGAKDLRAVSTFADPTAPERASRLLAHNFCWK